MQLKNMQYVRSSYLYPAGPKKGQPPARKSSGSSRGGRRSSSGLGGRGQEEEVLYGKTQGNVSEKFQMLINSDMESLQNALLL
jgi:hypothetical protein